MNVKPLKTKKKKRKLLGNPAHALVRLPKYLLQKFVTSAVYRDRVIHIGSLFCLYMR